MDIVEEEKKKKKAKNKKSGERTASTSHACDKWVVHSSRRAPRTK
jgi:hypothetical protein